MLISKSSQKKVSRSSLIVIEKLKVFFLRPTDKVFE